MTAKRTILETWQGDWLRVDKERVTLPNGHVIELDLVKHPGATCIVPFTKDDDVVLIRQFRPATGGEILELAAGKLEAGEEPDQWAAPPLGTAFTAEAGGTTAAAGTVPGRGLTGSSPRPAGSAAPCGTTIPRSPSAVMTRLTAEAGAGPLPRQVRATLPRRLRAGDEGSLHRAGLSRA